MKITLKSIVQEKKLGLELDTDIRRVISGVLLPLFSSGINCETAIMVYSLRKGGFQNTSEGRDSFREFCKIHGNSGFSDPTIKRALSFLKEAKFITKHRQSIYELSIEELLLS